MNDIEFTRNLVKGKIVETVFAQMFRSVNDFTVIPFGYENLMPELVLAGYQENNETLKTLRSAPDFAVIDRNTKTIYLVEVKYLKDLSPTKILNYAQKMSMSWNPSYLFVANTNGFFFDSIETIIQNNGAIAPFNIPAFSKEIQKQYLKIINEFEN